MNVNDINRLRKAGRLNEAYQAAEAFWQQFPFSAIARNAMAWVVYDLARQNATFERQQQFLRCLDKINSIGMPTVPDDTFWPAVEWLARGMVATVDRHTSTRGLPADTRFFDQLLQRLLAMPLRQPSDHHSALLQTMLRVKVDWNRFDEFCRWWDFQNLRPDDFLPFETQGGQRVRPLAERAFMAYSKCLWQKPPSDYTMQWAERLALISQQHPDYTFMPFYRAKLMIKCGRSAEARAVLTPFAQRKQNDFWVWELLGDIADEHRRLPFYAKAALCAAPPEMLVNLREKLAAELARLQHWPQAKTELQTLVHTRRAKQWAIPAKVMEMTSQPWFEQTQADTRAADFYRPLAQQAEKEVLGYEKKQKPFEGTIRINPKGGFGKVGDVFVPAKKAARFQNGDKVCGIAETSVDRKKNRVGWSAISIKPKKGQGGCRVKKVL